MDMKVLVIGAGNMGSAFVQRLHAAGHTVSVTAKGSDKPAALAGQFPGVRAVASDNAAAGQDLVVLATSYDTAVEALQSVGSLDGKTVIDITNPLTADYMGLTIGHAVPGANIVKAFNTVFAQVLAAGPDFGNGQTVTVFVASDSAAGKQTVVELAKSLGFQTIDAGGLKNARYLEPLAGLNIYLGYGAGLGTEIAPAWIRKG
jgi:predicted dinucleotide-binding enzyme